MDADDRVGTVLQDRYRILEHLAEGGMGVVYRGERLTLERMVAIKFLHAGFSANADSIKRFERELKAMSRLNHPNCVSVIDYGFDGSPYYVMDYITGQTLKDELGHGRFPPGRAIHVTIQILAALTHAHGQGMVHRDIKPANIILTHAEGAHDHVYVLDFGLAKFMSSARNDDLTASWMVLGTPSYMSPEQARGEAVDVASDVYSTAALLFELLTGAKLYASDNPIDTLHKHQSAPIPSLRERVPETAFSEELEQVMRKALAKDPGERFRTAAEFTEALETVPEAAYTPRASSQMRAQTGSLFPLPERAPSAEMLSMADAEDVRDASDGTAQARSPAQTPAQRPDEAQPKGKGKGKGRGKGKGKGKKGKNGSAESLAHTVPLQKPESSDEQSEGEAATALLSAGAAAAAGAETDEKRSTAATVALRKESDGSDEQAPAAPEAARAAPGPEQTPAQAQAAAAPGQAANTTGQTGVVARPDTPARSGARVLFALLLPVGVAAATWYLLYSPGQSDAQTEQPLTAAGTQAAEDGGKGEAGTGASQGQEQPPAPAPVETIRDVEKLIEDGKPEQAIQGILKLRRTDFPNSAYLPYLLGNLYFDKVWWSDGIDAYQEALRLNRSYRTKAKINENAIRALSHDQARRKANTLFLRYIKRSGLPYLRKAAKSDKNGKVRRRAAWLIKRITRRRRR